MTPDQTNETINKGNELFPVFLKLNLLHVVLIGGGNVGLEKLSAVLTNSPQARVTIVAKEVLQEVRDYASAFPQVTIKEQLFAADCLDMANIVIAATNNNSLNEQIRLAAHERNLLVNIADKPDLCDFYLGSIVRKGDLKIAISTNGKSPTTAKRLKEVLSEALPYELDATLQQMSALRNTLTGNFADKVKKLNEITSVLTEPGIEKEKKGRFDWIIWLALLIAMIFVMVLALKKL